MMNFVFQNKLKCVVLEEVVVCTVRCACFSLLKKEMCNAPYLLGISSTVLSRVKLGEHVAE